MFLGSNEMHKAAHRNGMKFQILYLLESIMVDSPELYLEGVQWSKVYLSTQHYSLNDIESSLRILSNELKKNASDGLASIIEDYVMRGIAQLKDAPDEIRPFIDADLTEDEPARNYLQFLLQGSKAEALQYIRSLTDGGHDIHDVYIGVFEKTQKEIGRLWQQGLLSTAKEHYCTAVTQLALAQLYPTILEKRMEIKKRPKGVVACVEGELHEFGARMIADFHEMEGWDIQYLGANTPSREVQQTVRSDPPDVLFISATMLFNIRKVISIIEGIDCGTKERNTKILVGGHPFNVDLNLWKKVGADGYAANANQSVVVSRSLLEARRG